MGVKPAERRYRIKALRPGSPPLWLARLGVVDGNLTAVHMTTDPAQAALYRSPEAAALARDLAHSAGAPGRLHLEPVA